MEQVLTTLGVLFGLALSELIRGPNDVSAVRGSTISLPCYTNLSLPVVWQFSRSGGPVDWLYIYEGSPASVKEEYRHKYSVTVDSTQNQYNLTITNLQPEDSGTYRCSDDHGLALWKHEAGLPNQALQANVTVIADESSHGPSAGAVTAIVVAIITTIVIVLVIMLLYWNRIAIYNNCNCNHNDCFPCAICNNARRERSSNVNEEDHQQQMPSTSNAEEHQLIQLQMPTAENKKKSLRSVRFGKVIDQLKLSARHQERNADNLNLDNKNNEI